VQSDCHLSGQGRASALCPTLLFCFDISSRSILNGRRKQVALTNKNLPYVALNLYLYFTFNNLVHGKWISCKRYEWWKNKAPPTFPIPPEEHLIFNNLLIVTLRQFVNLKLEHIITVYCSRVTPGSTLLRLLWSASPLLLTVLYIPSNIQGNFATLFFFFFLPSHYIVNEMAATTTLNMSGFNFFANSRDSVDLSADKSNTHPKYRRLKPLLIRISAPNLYIPLQIISIHTRGWW
jgi:hypothetical protein